MKPQLAPPGAGLPFPQPLVLRYLVGPFVSRRAEWEESRARFETEGERILKLVEGISPELLNRPVLVGRLPGIEDSSRFWSVGMTLDHLMIVGKQIEALVLALSAGKTPPGRASIAAVKPAEFQHGEETLAAFEKFVCTTAKELLDKVQNKNSPLTFDHPWFGPFTARQWYWLLGVHQQIHRRQIAQILKLAPLPVDLL